jgi:hypothetical protein
VLTTDGELIIARRNPDKYGEIRRYEVSDTRTWAHPVLAGDAIVIRDANSLAAWSFR